MFGEKADGEWLRELGVTGFHTQQRSSDNESYAKVVERDVSELVKWLKGMYQSW